MFYCTSSLFQFFIPNYKFYFLFDTWNIIKSNVVGTVACIPPHAPCTRSRFIFSVSPIQTKLYAHPRMTMASMHDEYRSFPKLDAFSRVFPATKPYNTAPTWRNVCFVSELVHTLPGGHIGHAHMLPNVGVISCMPPHALCTSRTIRVCRRSGLKLVFLDGPTKWSQTSCIPYDDHGMHAWQVSFICDTRCIL